MFYLSTLVSHKHYWRILLLGFLWPKGLCDALLFCIGCCPGRPQQKPGYHGRVVGLVYLGFTRFKSWHMCSLRITFFLLLPLQHLHSTHRMHIHSCHHLVLLFSTSQSLLLWVLVLINCICFQLTFTWAPFIYHNVEARLWKSQNRYKKQRETRIIIAFFAIWGKIADCQILKIKTNTQYFSALL